MKHERQGASLAAPAFAAIERRNRAQPISWLHVGFALTGVGTTMFGCILPSLHLDDGRAGIIFAAQFTGSALGALLVRRDFFRSLLRGYFLLIPSAIAITFASGTAEILIFFIFGLGLGLAMTATSMFIGGAFVANRGAALSVLNAYWGMGATLTPAVVSLWLARRLLPAYLYLVLAVILAVTLQLASSKHARTATSASDVAHSVWSPAPLKAISILAVFALLYVGTEASVSGWMMTYVHRLPITNAAWAPITTSCFWIALLLGRTLVPAALRRLSEEQLLTSSLAIAFISVLSLLLSRAPLAIVLSSTMAGLMLGPIFPLCLAKVLTLMHDSPASKWIFAISGLGGAALPWMTGELSVYSGSLRSGLLVPVIALATMIVLHRVGREIPERL